jgi:hypothetical protein
MQLLAVQLENIQSHDDIVIGDHILGFDACEVLTAFLEELRQLPVLDFRVTLTFPLELANSIDQGLKGKNKFCLRDIDHPLAS